MILVKKLIEEIVREAIEVYAKDDGYWLKLYHFTDSIDRYVFNKLETKDCQRQKQFAILRELDKLQDDINELKKLDDLENQS